MCGIAGLWNPVAPWDAPALEANVRAMARTVASRGPDGEGVWSDPAAGIALGHRRLAILDLSPAGAQPMTSPSGRWVVVFNGEIYNHLDLRLEPALAQHAFRGTSDTETLLAAVDAFGLDGAIARLNGMFALALWDRQTRTLHLVRDRLGIKPLYYGHAGGAFVFGSQPKALRSAPGFDATLDRSALAAFVRCGYVPSPLSIYRDVRKLPAGCRAVVTSPGEVRVERYWSMAQIAATSERGAAGTDAEAIERLDALLGDAVRLQMISDVPLGAFLSGGIDSSLVTALMARQGGARIATYTIGFPDFGFDESPHAQAIAAHLGTDHHSFTVTADEALRVIPTLPAMYDEPFADMSQIPTAVVSQIARRHVTVVLTGDGGDELFAGYDRYRWARTLLARGGAIPRAVRASLGAAARGAPAPLLDALGAAPGLRLDADRIRKGAELLGFRDRGDLYRRLMTIGFAPDALVPDAPAPAWLADADATFADATEAFQLADIGAYMVDDVLTKVDRASMAVGLEARVPLLDHRLAEFTWTLRPDQRHRGASGKWILRQVLKRYVPEALFERPKSGFGVPMEAWLRGPLRAWAEELLSPRALADAGLFEPAPVRTAWAEHISGRRRWHYRLWPVLMAQAWIRQEGEWTPAR